MRLLSRPACPLEARLGWGPAASRTEVQTARQLGLVRAAEVKLRRRRSSWCGYARHHDVLDDALPAEPEGGCGGFAADE